MIKSSVTENIRKKYVSDYLENSERINYTELTAEDGLVSVLYKNLGKTVIEGYPFASDFVSHDGTAYTSEEFEALSKQQQAKCDLRFHYLPYSHELYVGTTGSGKTTGCIEPELRAISSQKNKPDLFLTDPKGELFARNAEHLKENGYDIFILNFKDISRSDKWNPLLELYETKMQAKAVGENSVERHGKPKPSLKVIYNDPFDGESYIEYNGFAFPSKSTFKTYCDFEVNYLEAKIDSLTNQIAHMMITVQSRQDASWEYGSQDLLKGILQCMLEDAADENSGFTSDMMTLKTIQQYYLALKLPILDNSSSTTLYNHQLLRNKSAKPKALMATALANASNTMRSYCGVFDGATKDWFQGHIFALTTGNTIKISGKKPFAIFVATRDYEKSDFKVAGLFIDWIYRQMVERAESTPNPRAVHFLLDEFGNIPEIKDFENKVSTSRSRNIWFHLAVQSYKQIDLVYGADRSTIIRDNCNAQIFLGAQNRTTKEIFSAECGKHYIPTLQSKLVTSDNSICEVPLVPVSDLESIKPGTLFVKRLFMPLVISQFVRSYICAEKGFFKHFFEADGIEKIAPRGVESFNSERYTHPALSLDPPKLGEDIWSDFDID